MSSSSEQFTGERILRHAADLAARVDDQHPGILPSARQPRPDGAQGIQGGPAAADPAIPRVRDGQVDGVRDLALVLAAPDLVHVTFGVLGGTGGENDGVPPRRLRSA